MLSNSSTVLSDLRVSTSRRRDQSGARNRDADPRLSWLRAASMARHFARGGSHAPAADQSRETIRWPDRGGELFPLGIELDHRFAATRHGIHPALGGPRSACVTTG